jgi:para-aminobenzoate synthetase component 1
LIEVGSLDAVDTTLRAHGFYGGGAEGVVADVYLGYGLSSRLRRGRTPSPPEPCPLPSAALRIRPEDEAAAAGGEFSIGEWELTWSTEEHAAAVVAVRDAIAHGDVYQVNLVQHLSAPFAGDPAGLVEKLDPLRPLHPRAFVGAGWAIVSASPELFLARRGRRVWTMPIKGTRPAGGNGLTESDKDAAEHVMIVDLERNDLSRVCEPGSVTWPELMAPRPLAGVEHLVSLVEGTLRQDVTLTELLAATFPGGSVTGAPKISAIDHIAELEPVGRGASMGALGTIRPNGDFDLALTIRTFAVAEGRIHLWVGGGIVWDSDPAEEIEESWVKARPLLAAIGARPPRSARRGSASAFAHERVRR